MRFVRLLTAEEGEAPSKACLGPATAGQVKIVFSEGPLPRIMVREGAGCRSSDAAAHPPGASLVPARRRRSLLGGDLRRGCQAQHADRLPGALERGSTRPRATRVIPEGAGRATVRLVGAYARRPTAGRCARCCATAASRFAGCCAARRRDVGHPGRCRSALIPVLVLARRREGAAPSAMVDSTFQIRRLESACTGEPHRSCRRDPALAFLDALDRGLRRRVAHQGDVPLPLGVRRADVGEGGDVPAAATRSSSSPSGGSIARRASRSPSARSTGSAWSARTRRPRPVIEASYGACSTLLDAHLDRAARSCSARGPARADFALYGQLHAARAVRSDADGDRGRRVAPRVRRVGRTVVDDLRARAVASDGWISRDAIPATLRALLAEVGRVYAPFLLANAAALARRRRRRSSARSTARRGSRSRSRIRGSACAGSASRLHGARRGATARGADGALAGTGCDDAVRELVSAC